jgi:hypothetical protein
MKAEFKFKLSKPIKYQGKKQGGGFEFKECNELILKAPSKKNQYLIGERLQGMFSTASIRMSKEVSSSDDYKNFDRDGIKEEVEIDEKTVRLILIVGLKEDREKFYKAFESLLLKDGICFINEEKMTEAELNNLNHNDFKELMIEYISNFFLTCWMKELGIN